MDDEPFVKPGFDWKKQLTTVTPISKILAMALFVLLPFGGFVLGMRYEDVRVTTYEPIIVERVFEKEVVVESASTSTPEVKIIIFSGAVRDGGQNKCMVDGICSILVSEYEVIWAEGWNDEPVGTKDVVRPGDRVEIYGRVVDDSKVSLYGNENYYIKKISSGEAKSIDNERSVLMSARTEGGKCSGGECWSETTIYVDGFWQYEDLYGSYIEGVLDKKYIDMILENVAVIEFDVLKRNAFEGTCPTAVDGQKSIYTLYSELGKQIIDTCVIDVSKESFFQNELLEILEVIETRVGIE